MSQCIAIFRWSRNVKIWMIIIRDPYLLTYLPTYLSKYMKGKI